MNNSRSYWIQIFRNLHVESYTRRVNLTGESYPGKSISPGVSYAGESRSPRSKVTFNCPFNSGQKWEPSALRTEKIQGAGAECFHVFLDRRLPLLSLVWGVCLTPMTEVRRSPVLPTRDRPGSTINYANRRRSGLSGDNMRLVTILQGQIQSSDFFTNPQMA